MYRVDSFCTPNGRINDVSDLSTCLLYDTIFFFAYTFFVGCNTINAPPKNIMGIKIKYVHKFKKCYIPQRNIEPYREKSSIISNYRDTLKFAGLANRFQLLGHPIS
uniref:Uncharacterized protein n=1 Tax=Glossina brevipalpis TaxID=37001 RepID=A0A1A9W082_9MUSC